MKYVAPGWLLVERKSPFALMAEVEGRGILRRREETYGVVVEGEGGRGSCPNNVEAFASGAHKTTQPNKKEYI